MEDLDEQRKKVIGSFKKLGNIFREDSSATSHEPPATSQDKSISEQREELIHSFKTLSKSKFLYSILLIPILLIAFYVRTRNLKHLAGKYLLGLDPNVFHRYAQYILENGSLMANDAMRYVPIGFTPNASYKFVSYNLAYLYKFFFKFFGLTQMEWHIIYPPIITIASLVFFYLFVKEIFNGKTALISTAFLAVIPAYIYRTGAGFADHEAIAMFYLFIALFFFAKMWKANLTKSIIFGAVSGLLSACMALSWGGYKILTLSIGSFIIAAILLTDIKKKHFIAYTCWLAVFLAILIPSFGLGVIKEFQILPLLFSFAVFVVYFALNLLKIEVKKIPQPILALIIVLVVGLIVAFAFGIFDSSIIYQLEHPAGTNRLSFTVSENQQPFFLGGNGWWNSFGLFFLIPFFGSVYVTYMIFRKSLKIALPLTITYLAFFSAFIFGRFSSEAKYASLVNFFSKTYFYWFAGFLLVVLIAYFYFYSKDRDLFERVFKTNWALLFILVWFLFSALIARGAMRTIFLFAPPTAVIAGYFVADLGEKLSKRRSTQIFAVLLILFAVFCFYANFQTAAAINRGSGSGLPGRWESSMNWLKNNTPEDSVVVHWWDYGYWTQSIAERATVVDGGNHAGWDHGVGRFVLTNPDKKSTLEYLKTHKVTHLLISSEEIGKYHAFATIGSDENMDRFSTIGVFGLQDQQEIRNGTKLFYSGTWGFDDDIVIGDKVFPKGQSAIIGISVLQTENAISEPTAYLYNNGAQFAYFLSCMVVNGQRLEFQPEGESLPGCIVFVPRFQRDGTGDPLGAILYASDHVKDSNFARLYMFGEQDPNFKEVYADETPFGIYEGSIIGPIRIWEVVYPADTKTDDKYLERSIYG